MKKVLVNVLSFLLSIAGALLGIYYNRLFLVDNKLVIVLTVLILIPLLLLFFHMKRSEHFIAKLKQMNVAEGNAFLVSHRDDAQSTAEQKLKELRGIRRKANVYTVFLAILSLTIALLSGMLMDFAAPYALICIVYAGFILSSVLFRIHGNKQFEISESAIILPRADFLLIYALARKAADSVGSKDEILIFPNWNCSVSIVKDKNRTLLQIGVVLLSVLSEQELYSIMLHEFAHVSAHSKAHYREEQYSRWLREEGGGTDAISAFLSNLYLIFATKYMFNYMIYQYASSVVNELQADRAMAEHGDAKIAVSALVKTNYSSMYDWETSVAGDPSIYQSEELEADYLTNRISDFKQAIEQRSEFWNELLKKEIIANNASHPTLRMRMEALGIDQLAIVQSQDSQEYLAQVQKVIEYSENVIYRERRETYQEERKEQYLQPLERIEAWKQAGEPITPENYADLISDLKTLGRPQEAEALCDRVIDQLPENSATHAIYIKGADMLYRYDANGMELVYSAMEKNGNYIDEGLGIIGAFCCMTGREQDLTEYRARAVQLGQKHLDEDEQISFLSKNDNLSAEENLPDGMLKDILDYIKSVDQGIIQNVYLVRKTVSETFFASVFIIQFEGGTDEQVYEIMHKIFRYLDCYPTEWQFSLFEYRQYPEVKVEKIAGSLVYSKTENE